MNNSLNNVRYSKNVVSAIYRSPELFSFEIKNEIKYGFGIDIWAAGCVIFEMETSVPLFLNTSISKYMETIDKLPNSKFLNKMTYKYLLLRMLDPCDLTRINANECLELIN